MESRQLRSIGVLTVVLLGLTGLLVWTEEGPSIEEDGLVDVVSQFELGTASSIEIVRADPERGTVRLHKRDGIWSITEPFGAEADPDAVIEILDAAREARRGRPVDGELSTFGLDEPAAVLTITLEGGDTRVLAVGNTDASKMYTYVATPTGPAAVTGTPGEVLVRRANEYRDHKVFRYDPADVTRISIESDLGLLEATKTDGGWFLTGFGRADLDKLDNWIVDFTQLRADLFLDLGTVEPESPRYTVQVDAAGETQTMWVGRDTPYGPLIFFGEGLNGPMPPAMLTLLERGPTDVGESDVFPDTDGVTRVILAGETTRTLVRNGPDWTGAPQAAHLIEALSGPQWVYKREPPAWTSTELTVTLEGDDPRVYEIGPVGAEGFRAVRDAAGGTPMRVPADELEFLF